MFLLCKHGSSPRLRVFFRLFLDSTFLILQSVDFLGQFLLFLYNFIKLEGLLMQLLRRKKRDLDKAICTRAEGGTMKLSRMISPYILAMAVWVSLLAIRSVGVNATRLLEGGAGREESASGVLGSLWVTGSEKASALEPKDSSMNIIDIGYYMYLFDGSMLIGSKDPFEELYGQERVDVVLHDFDKTASVELLQPSSSVGLDCELPHGGSVGVAVPLIVCLDVVSGHDEGSIAEADEDADESKVESAQLILLRSLIVVFVKEFLQKFLASQEADPTQGLLGHNRRESVEECPHLLRAEIDKQGAVVGRGHEPYLHPLKGADNGRLEQGGHHSSRNSSHRFRVPIILEYLPEVGNEVYIEWPSICAFAHDSRTVDSEPRVESFQTFPFVNFSRGLPHTHIL